MTTTTTPECTDCPLLDRTIKNGCPGSKDEPALPGITHTAITAGTHLFEEGEPIAGIHCLHSGRAALIKKRERKEYIVGVAVTGDVLGMPDILNGDLHRNGALAIEETSLCFIPKDEALKLLRDNPQIMLRIMRVICGRISLMEEHLDNRGAEKGE